MRAEADWKRSMVQFREQHAATLQAQAEALIGEAVAALAELFGQPAHAVCLTCRRALAPRVRNCPHCRGEAHPETTDPAAGLPAAS
jgi:hypothetical protein